MLASRHDFDCFTSSTDSLLVLEGVTTPTTVAVGVDGLELPLRVIIFVKLDVVQDQILLKADEGDSRR